MTDVDLAKELTDMGYEVGYNPETDAYNETLLVEMANNEGFKWDATKDEWE